MQEPIDISQKVFLKLEEILKKLSSCQSIDEILELQEENIKLQEYLSFLKVYKHFGENVSSFEGASEYTSDINDDVNIEHNIENEEVRVESAESEEKINIQQLEVLSSETDSEYSGEKFESEVLDELQFESLHHEKAEPAEAVAALAEEAEEEEEETEEEETEEEEVESILPEVEMMEEDSIISDDAPEINVEPEVIENKKVEVEEVFISAEEAQHLELKHQEERKFRLANIKGVKKMETLFEDEFFVEEQSKNKSTKGGNLIKSNVSLNYMEVEKPKPIFKLDLNDRIAFTKKLFSGSQSDLNNAVTRLNEFETLDEAKEYLSEIYYEKGWEKEDEFAQRLWNLVESKF